MESDNRKLHAERWNLIRRFSIAWIRANRPDVWAAFWTKAESAYPMPRVRRSVHSERDLALVKEIETAPDGTAVDLTRREREVLLLVRMHYTNKEIAQQLVFTERTAKAHVSVLLSKFGARKRKDLIGGNNNGNSDGDKGKSGDRGGMPFGNVFFRADGAGPILP